MMRKKAKRKGYLEPMAGDVHSIVRRLARGEPAVHPELWARWGDIVGPQLCRRCVPLSLRNGRLLVGVSSSTWLHELSFLIRTLIDRFADEIGPGVVKDIRLIIEPHIFARKSAPGRETPPSFQGALPANVKEVLDGISDEELRRSAEKAFRANLGAHGQANK